MKTSWGHLGRPPQWVLEGPKHVVDQYKKFVDEEQKIMRMPPKLRTVKLAELRVRFLRAFPAEKPE